MTRLLAAAVRCNDCNETVPCASPEEADKRAVQHLEITGHAATAVTEAVRGAVSELRELVRDPAIAGMCQVVIHRVACGQPLESTWEGGCVHEHVTTDIGICLEHRRLAETPFTCVLCEPDHKCMVQLREVRRP